MAFSAGGAATSGAISTPDNYARLLGITLRLVLGAALSIGIVWAYGNQIAQAYLPLLHWSYSHLDTDHRILTLTIETQGAVRGSDHVFQMVVAPRAIVFVGDRLVSTDPKGWAKVTVLTAYLWQAMVVALPFVLAWPVRKAREWPVRLSVLSALLFVFSILEVPMELWASVWRIYIDAFAAGRFSALLSWVSFLETGGRLFLGLVAAGISVTLTSRLFRTSKSI